MTRRIGRYSRMLALCALAAAATGCNRTPLRADGQRSQFDRYDQTRNDFAQPYLEDEFGRRMPNLRGRLLGHN